MEDAVVNVGKWKELVGTAAATTKVLTSCKVKGKYIPTTTRQKLSQTKDALD